MSFALPVAKLVYTTASLNSTNLLQFINQSNFISDLYLPPSTRKNRNQFDAEGARAWLSKNFPASDPLLIAPASDFTSPLAPVVKAPGFMPGTINFLRTTARSFIRSLRGKSFMNEDTHQPILVDKTSEHKTVSGLRRPEELHVLSALPEMLRRAKYDSSAADDGSHPGVLNWDYYQVPVEVAGRVHEAIIVVRKMSGGRRFYDSYFLRIDGPAGGLIPPRSGLLLDRTIVDPTSTGPRELTVKSENVNHPQNIQVPETDQALPPTPNLLPVKEFASWPDQLTDQPVDQRERESDGNVKKNTLETA